MCRVAATQLNAAPSSSHESRRWIAGLLERWELQELSQPAQLLISELATNAIQHASSAPRLVATVADGVLEVGVSDDQQLGSPTVKRRPTGLDDEDLMAEGGRGLMLVDALADEWGTVGLSEGKQVWFRLNSPNWSYRSACRCHRDDVARVRLESGAYALALAGPWDDPGASTDT